MNTATADVVAAFGARSATDGDACSSRAGSGGSKLVVDAAAPLGCESARCTRTTPPPPVELSGMNAGITLPLLLQPAATSVVDAAAATFALALLLFEA